MNKSRTSNDPFPPGVDNGQGGRGILFVLSSPSGGGKTTLCRRLLEEVPDLAMSVSHTTRAPRGGERPGIDYHFVSEDEFGRMGAEGQFLEWAEVHGRRYGTSRWSVEGYTRKGMDVLLDIDVQGGRQIKARFPAAVLIFILPPSPQELRRRLLARGTETAEAVEARMTVAEKELALLDIYDYAVLNDDLDRAFQALRSVVVAERCRVSRQGKAPQPRAGGR